MDDRWVGRFRILTKETMEELLPFRPADVSAIAHSGPGALTPPLQKQFSGDRLSDQDRDAILAKKSAGLTHSEIARELGLSRNTVSNEVRRAEKDGRLPAARQRMAEKLEDIAEEHLDLKMRTPGKMSALDFAIYVDKAQLLQGMPTAVVAVARKEDEAAVLEDLKRLSEGFIDVETTPVPECTPPPQLNP